MNTACQTLLVVPPFECAWLVDEELRFSEAGRGCVAFEACADNDITVVFKEKAGSKHYRTDVGPSYTVVLGSHRNRRSKIEVDGETVVDVAGIAVCSSHFERYWISVNDGHIMVGKGDPGKGVLLEWADSHPNRSIQYVGLSSWDKHVGYRNIRVLPQAESAPASLLQVWQKGAGGLAPFLENPELSDLQFIVGSEGRIVPAHRVVLASCCTGFPGSLLIAEDVIRLPSVEYPILHALLEYLYTGRTQVTYSQLGSIEELSEEFGLETLARHCGQLQGALGKELGSKSFDGSSGQTVEVVYRTPVEFLERRPAFSVDIPVNTSELKDLYCTGKYVDTEIFLDGHGLVARAHRLVLSAWSTFFAKLFTNGMCESNTTKINISDVAPEVFLAMLNFMYGGHLELDERDDAGSLLLPLLILADRFGIPLLQQECMDQLLECISEDSVCPILHVVASMQSCQSLQDICEVYFAKHFEQCLQNTLEVKDLDLAMLKRIFQNFNLCVTSEEKVLNAILTWASQLDSLHGWIDANEHLRRYSIECLFGDRMDGLIQLLPFVRFALIPLPVLQQLESCTLSRCISRLQELIREALDYLEPKRASVSFEQEDGAQFLDINNQGRLIQFSKNSLRVTHRSSSLKELSYMCDGDRNGVIYYAGTSYGAHPWMNPVLIKRISVSASSPLSRYTDAKALVSRQYQGTNFAGPVTEEGQTTSWWRIDLGEENQLMCNYYTLRQDSSMIFLRFWSLQGSVDGEKWIDIKIHVNDLTMSRPGQFASWPVRGAQALIPFRFFRVKLIRPTESTSNPWNLCLCYIELYGYFHGTNEEQM